MMPDADSEYRLQTSFFTFSDDIYRLKVELNIYFCEQ